MSKNFIIPVAINADPPVFDRARPWLAPMAGYTDLPFRLLCSHFGAAVCETEMISAAGIMAGNQATADLLNTSADEKRVVAQLFGSDCETIRCAAKKLREKGWLWLDFNIGCPARKVMRQGAGSRLLENPGKIMDIARAMIEETGKISESYVNPFIQGKTGFKLRLGYENGQNTALELAPRLEDAGAAWITLHPRYGKQGFSGEADWQEIEKLSSRLSIPLIASGDLLSAEKGLDCLASTGATSVMYARGALANPAIFKAHEALAEKSAPLSLSRERLCEIIKLHVEFAQKYYSSPGGFYKIRSILPRYVRNHPGVGQFRANLSHCNDWDTLIKEIENFMEY